MGRWPTEPRLPRRYRGLIRDCTSGPSDPGLQSSIALHRCRRAFHRPGKESWRADDISESPSIRGTLPLYDRGLLPGGLLAIKAHRPPGHSRGLGVPVRVGMGRDEVVALIRASGSDNVDSFRCSGVDRGGRPFLGSFGGAFDKLPLVGHLSRLWVLNRRQAELKALWVSYLRRSKMPTVVTSDPLADYLGLADLNVGDEQGRELIITLGPGRRGLRGPGRVAVTDRGLALFAVAQDTNCLDTCLDHALARAARGLLIIFLVRRFLPIVEIGSRSIWSTSLEPAPAQTQRVYSFSPSRTRAFLDRSSP